MDMDTSSSSSHHEAKFRVYNEALMHAARCIIPQCDANDGRCHKIKASIDHFVRCYGPRRKYSAIESCPNCSKIWGLLCYHAKYCTTPLNAPCIVSQCDYLRAKIAKKEQERDQNELATARNRLVHSQQAADWPVERRIQQNEQDRQEVLQLIAMLRHQKAMKEQQQGTMMSIG